MSKRFTDTDLWDKEWFMKLSTKHKLMVRFLFDKCDAAGVWSPNWILASAYIGEGVSGEDLKSLNGQIELLSDGKIFIPGFVEFQYGRLSETCMPHKKIFTLLSKYNLLDRVVKGYTKGIDTLQEKEEDKDKDKEKNERGSGGKQTRHKASLDFEDSQKEIKADYSGLIASIEGKDKKTCWEEIRKFIIEKKPQFIEPYIDVWNLFATTYSLIQKPISITEDRRKKFRIRIKEPMFDFIEILKVIQKSSFLRGQNDRNWKVDLDFILQSESNYIKILENKYE